MNIKNKILFCKIDKHLCVLHDCTASTYLISENSYFEFYASFRYVLDKHSLEQNL